MTSNSAVFHCLLYVTLIMYLRRELSYVLAVISKTIVIKATVCPVNPNGSIVSCNKTVKLWTRKRSDALSNRSI